MLLTAVSVGVLAWVAFLGTVAGLYVVNAILSNTPEERKQASSATGATVLCLVGVGTSGCVAYTLSKDMTQKEHRTAIELGLILDAFSCLAALVLFRVTKCSEWFDAHPSVQLQHTAYGTTESIMETSEPITDSVQAHAWAYGVGLEFAQTGKFATVTSMIPGGSARLSCAVEIGDRLVDIDGCPVDGVDITTIRERISGPAGTSVRLRLVRVGFGNFEV
mmetsp:Transcript_27091/g.58836  ORF Transcript_27091/g.58836 Transcript_27091/m.58836 type:complete len:220 (-) Transcript_27091:1942-2601(-)|eukprot:CAMPEP_0175827058 /NCGR_PEP_ID=MMETSP0107_2-20121207/12087_1 /TAXON_ID=195067 ORGANISM="Goniomonas pacifica, Strain CCMP1869" /NCGR_SAMPLE_ID=MMETSP0107_2 /ASSEMBLY_ACC=CAM_ASM_000203 /LENGTH=219 /DNA_ID=CAMNT_0017139721 /DNA_START=841 /DNA_END=1500 /DNA_ORIENTATION=-